MSPWPWDYGSKLKKYCSWCCTRKINPNSATLNQVADFLSDLFNEGLQYRTIAGYRSMPSSQIEYLWIWMINFCFWLI
jgi:site-specific recombinase XerD